MLGSCLLSGFIIGFISTCVYILVSDNKEKDNNLNEKDKKMNYILIFSINVFVSFIILFISNRNSSEQIIPIRGGFSPKVNNQPPF